MAVVDARTKDEVEEIASLMGKAMEAPIEVEKLAVRVSLSIGISMFPMNGRSAAELLRKADNAMYRIKKSSRDGYAFSHEGSSDHQAV
jgi:diguanylate cyclase (GGDEF)-like protein